MLIIYNADLNVFITILSENTCDLERKYQFEN